MGVKSFKRDINPVLEIIGRDYEEVREIPIDEVIIGEPFMNLFIIRDDVYTAILHSIKEHGYDKAQPLIVWREKNILIDGHTRLEAAKEMGVKYIPIIENSFADEDTALDYVYKLQFARRNLKGGELIYLAISPLKRYKKSYGEGGKPEYLAKRFTGLSVGKAAKLITVLDHAAEAQIEDIREDNATISAVYKNLKRVHVNPFQKDKISLNISPKDEETLEAEGIEEYAEAEPRAESAESKLVDSPKAAEPAAEEQTFETTDDPYVWAKTHNCYINKIDTFYFVKIFISTYNEKRSYGIVFRRLDQYQNGREESGSFELYNYSYL